MKLSQIFSPILSIVLPLILCGTAYAQINTGSNGSDGALDPTTNTVINMADHPNGIYQYTSVNIPIGVTVKFIPNANNTPVVWLVQSNCVISGTVDVLYWHQAEMVTVFGHMVAGLCRLVLEVVVQSDW